MNLLLRAMPERCFDVGIAEGHAVTFSAGLAAAGIVPFCNIYSTFMQRAFDNVIHDVAIQRLPVVLCLDRGGPGGWRTVRPHLGSRSIWPIFGCIPNLTVASSARRAAELLQPALYGLCRSGWALSSLALAARPRARGAAWRDEALRAVCRSGPAAAWLTEGDDMAVLDDRAGRERRGRAAVKPGPPQRVFGFGPFCAL